MGYTQLAALGRTRNNETSWMLICFRNDLEQSSSSTEVCWIQHAGARHWYGTQSSHLETTSWTAYQCLWVLPSSARHAAALQQRRCSHSAAVHSVCASLIYEHSSTVCLCVFLNLLIINAKQYLAQILLEVNMCTEGTLFCFRCSNTVGIMLACWTARRSLRYVRFYYLPSWRCWVIVVLHLRLCHVLSFPVIPCYSTSFTVL